MNLKQPVIDRQEVYKRDEERKREKEDPRSVTHTTRRTTQGV